ncbi:glycosyltransferase [Candidatus Pelagadaptatus aseana]|uniref:glycosyltransferase n=1 Tax=Candidatus Pelagadaptatus aseana TaxID=3120508 RepID=UPI003C6EF7F7
MARILCVWEMGSSLGHLTNLKLFIDEALQQGHKVSLAVRELQNVTTVFDLGNIQLLQAPFIKHPRRKYKTPMISISQLILRQVFTNPQELAGLYHSWNSLFDLVRPDVVIYDHAPSALVASFGKPWQKWVIGSGFLVPRSDGPFLGVFPGTPKSRENDGILEQSERQLLALINQVLAESGRAEMTSVKDIYQQCDQQLLLTLPELDHFGRRPKGNYLGLKWNVSTNPAHWLPRDARYKAFAYLSFFPALPKLLNELIARDVNLLLYSRNLPPELVRDYSDRVAFTDQPVDLKQVLGEVDFVINHGNHASAAQAYTMGCPQLLLPNHQEQLFLSRRVEQQGGGVVAIKQQEDLSEVLDRLMQLAHGGLPKPSESIDQVVLFDSIHNLMMSLTE